MFGLIRRLSHSVIPRPDRPWEDDPTSNAPHKPRKRRLSTSEQEDGASNSGSRPASTARTGYIGESATKRARGEGTMSSGVVDEFGGWSVPLQQQQDQHQNQSHQQQQEEGLTPSSPAVEQQQEQQIETQGVKEVTQGVKEVELEEKEGEQTRAGEAEMLTKAVKPESIPLPDEDEVDELDDESGSNAGKDKEVESATVTKTVEQDKEEQAEEEDEEDEEEEDTAD